MHLLMAVEEVTCEQIEAAKGFPGSHVLLDKPNVTDPFTGMRRVEGTTSFDAELRLKCLKQLSYHESCRWNRQLKMLQDGGLGISRFYNAVNFVFASCFEVVLQ